VSESIPALRSARHLPFLSGARLSALGGSISQRRGFADGAAPAWLPPAWATRQLLLPLLAFVAANFVLLGLDGDRRIADWIFALEGHRWALQDIVFTTEIIHVGGKRLSALAWLVVVAFAIAAWRRDDWAHLRRPLVCLALSVAVSTLLVSYLKHATHMDCPWDLSAYGGSRPYFGLFDARPASLHSSGCFPAGHASAGYAWAALYFFFLSTRREWRWFGLGVGLAAGLVFGISQQLRGAHFLSHDVWSLMLCWLTALLLHRATVRWSLARAALAARRNASTAIARSEHVQGASQ
jgi:membrane-associated PAP2 superfamily phosphatase